MTNIDEECLNITPIGTNKIIPLKTRVWGSNYIVKHLVLENANERFFLYNKRWF